LFKTNVLIILQQCVMEKAVRSIQPRMLINWNRFVGKDGPKLVKSLGISSHIKCLDKDIDDKGVSTSYKMSGFSYFFHPAMW